MRILLDECLPRRLKREFAGHDVRTVPEASWAGRKDGELLQLMAGAYDAFITVDRGVPFQQNLAGRTFAIVVLHAPSNRLADLLPLMPETLRVLEQMRPGEVVDVGD